MKKKLLCMWIVFAVCMGFMTGCGPKKDNSINDASQVIGEVEQVKEFMFIVNDDSGASYAFSFTEKPEGLSEVSVGDTVVVTYTGVVSEIDPFMGEVLSVKKYE